MAIIKCKMCGGDLNIIEGASTAECEFCGSVQTLPKANDEVIQNLFNRANNLRIKCEFDKAEQIYEKILHENDAESEAHWGIVLCKYGIEYVEDPKSFKRIPTCHRTSYDAVTTDADYLAAIEHADDMQRHIYEAEAKAIDAIQKDILNIVKNEKPFDVFICYKETDENGKRTIDSTIANDIYYQLTQEGLKVFYAAITLEDKLGQEYEPYIFAALNSSKVMLVIGTKPQYFSAVWVKNEWSRFLKLMKADRSKLLIPCYKDMDAYDLPEEFSHLQAQDMSKIGFINDVVRGIKKVTVKDEPKAAVVNETAVAANANTAPLLKRAFMFLEDGEWNSANEYCEKVLDIDPECAEAYLCKLMASLRVRKQDALKDQAEPFDGNNNYQKTIRFADASLKSMLIGYIEHIKTRNENTRLEGIYIKAKQTMVCADEEASYRAAETDFRSILSYKDAAVLADQCAELAETTRKNDIYNRAKGLIQSNEQEKIEQAISLFESISGWLDADDLKAQCPELAEAARKDQVYNQHKRTLTWGGELLETDWRIAREGFESIAGWRDADALARQCAEQIEKIKRMQEECERQAEVERLERERQEEVERRERERQAEEARKEAERIAKRNKKIAIIAAAIVCAVIAVVIVVTTVIIPNSKYNSAIALMDEGKYDEAISAFEALDGYKDSAANITECKYAKALAWMDKGNYIAAKAAFASLGEYKDSTAKKAECENAIVDGQYNDAVALMNAGNVVDAYEAFVALDGYRDSTEKANSIYNKYKVEKLKVAKVGDYVLLGTYEQDNNTSNGKEAISWLVLEVKDGKALVISKYVLDCKYYHDTMWAATWESCSLRKWLNSDFINSAFSADEKAMIPTVTVSADKNPDYSTNQGNATQDQVFLLSITEANKYFSSNNAKWCDPTDYAMANGSSMSWWLRSLGQNGRHAAFVDGTGVVHAGGLSLDNGGYPGSTSVRPAMWIDLNA